MSVASDWDKIHTLDADQIISYNQLPITADSSALSKLAVLKFHGGLGTSMGTYIASLFSTRICTVDVNNQRWDRHVWREECP